MTRRCCQDMNHRVSVSTVNLPAGLRLAWLITQNIVLTKSCIA